MDYSISLKLLLNTEVLAELSVYVVFVGRWGEEVGIGKLDPAS
jgi:hypothetical protein